MQGVAGLDFVRKQYALFVVITLIFIAVIVLTPNDNAYFNRRRFLGFIKNKEPDRNSTSSLNFITSTYTTTKVTSVISATSVIQHTTVKIPKYDVNSLLRGVKNNLKKKGWKFHKNFAAYIENMKFNTTLAPTTTVNPREVLAIAERWKVRHVGCFRKKGDSEILNKANVHNDFQGDLKSCLKLCADRGEDWVAYDSAKNRCTCGISIVEFKILMIMRENVQNCTQGYEDVYRIDSYTPNESITMDTIKHTNAGCFFQPNGLNETFNIVNNNTSNKTNLPITDCLLHCEFREYPNAAWSSPGVCRCGQFSARFSLHQLGGPVEDSLCDNSACSSNAPCEYVRIMRTNAEDKRCDFKTFFPYPTGRMVPLISFPGSGNTWVRYLIETATGIYTGSVYQDQALYKEGFIGELLPWNSTLTSVVKTHMYKKEHAALYEEAIFVIRNPFDAILAEFNRMRGGHTGYAEEHLFNTSDWIYFIPFKLIRWIQSIENYTDKKRLLLMYFEDIAKDPLKHVRKMVKFLGYPIPDIEERLACLESNLSGSFTRQKRKLNFDPYPRESKNIINRYIKIARAILANHNLPPLPFYER